jgi:hypothetical protein
MIGQNEQMLLTTPPPCGKVNTSVIHIASRKQETFMGYGLLSLVFYQGPPAKYSAIRSNRRRVPSASSKEELPPAWVAQLPAAGEAAAAGALQRGRAPGAVVPDMYNPQAKPLP